MIGRSLSNLNLIIRLEFSQWWIAWCLSYGQIIVLFDFNWLKGKSEYPTCGIIVGRFEFRVIYVELVKCWMFILNWWKIWGGGILNLFGELYQARLVGWGIAKCFPSCLNSYGFVGEPLWFFAMTLHLAEVIQRMTKLHLHRPFCVILWGRSFVTFGNDLSAHRVNSVMRQITFASISLSFLWTCLILTCTYTSIQSVFLCALLCRYGSSQCPS